MSFFLHRLKSGIHNRPQFFLALLIGIVISLILTIITLWHWSTIILFSWNISVGIYLIHVKKMMWQADHSAMQTQAKKQDESKWVIMMLVILALLMCLIAIVMQLSSITKNTPFQYWHLGLALLTIISAWLFMHTAFALHYAHDFYIARSYGKEDGLDFPKTRDPMYPDFVYFSYIIGTSAQTADVSITSQHMRLLNIFHAMLAFGFNTTILAICINIAASFISG
ncbi:DUF1345 domain-containing protein [Acinetobacter guerrae]|uniref:DUF1345 domain-containing protein n=1 Tax=Acinetobacter guerrae TaxID=1843371 RepID=A0A3A8EWM5_9GAMM|nr:DUF1345 domain-containing protein [Acinetobacter guerrae]RKG34464.1 DUF1345 domain-containing protein [Acinetobacter guerrae]